MALDINAPTGVVVASSAEIADARRKLAAMQGSLDSATESTRRDEQRLLRIILLKNMRSAVCAICGNERPVDLVVIGHIKRRSSCSPDERKAEDNLIPVCLFGCDSLFEKGYLTVDEEGAIRTLPSKMMGPDLVQRMQSLEGRRCSAWNERSSRYFFWHRYSRRRFT